MISSDPPSMAPNFVPRMYRSTIYDKRAPKLVAMTGSTKETGEGEGQRGEEQTEKGGRGRD